MIPLWLCLAVFARDLPGENRTDHPWDLTHLDLTVRVDIDARTVSGIAAIDVKRLGQPAPTLRLHQRGLTIEEVRVDGREAPFRVRPDRIDIDIPIDREIVHVEVRYQTSPAAGMHFRGAGGPKGEPRVAWTQGEATDNRFWFPGWDDPTDRFTVSTHVEVPNGDTAFALGTLTSQTPLEDGWVRWSYALEQDVVNYLVTVVAGDLVETSIGEAHGVPLTLIRARDANEEAALRLVAPTSDMLAFFEDILDEPIAYPAYRQVVVPRFLYDGMENPGLVVLTDRYLLEHPDEDPARAHKTIAHELAHQWFGDLLTCYGWRNLWLNEGFATYWAGRWEDHSNGEASYAAAVRRWHKGALSGNTPMAPLSWTDAGPDNARVYVQGAAVLHMLEIHLGRPTFDRSVRRWVNEQKGQLVETHQLRRTLEDVSGRDLEPWFDAFVHDAGHATFSSEWIWDAEAKQVRITIEQTGERQPIGVPIEIGLAGTVALERTWVYEGKTTIVRPADQPPAYVAIDPRGGILAHWTRSQTPAQWVEQARSAPQAFARLEAIAQLAEVPEAEALEVLTDIVGDTNQPAPMRQAAAASLGQLPSTLAADALKDALNDAPSSLRDDLYDGLGQMKSNAPIPRLLRDARNASWPVRIDALNALAVAAPDRAAVAARRWLTAPDRTAQSDLHAAAIRTLGTVGSASDLPGLARRLSDTTPPLVLIRSIYAVKALGPSVSDSDPRRIAAARGLESLLSSTDLRTQRRAIWALGDVGDAESADRLMDYATEPQWDTNAESARATAKKIRAKNAPTPMANEDLIELEAQLKALQQRMEHLELHGSD